MRILEPATDFALDDVGFYEICELEDDVKIEVIPFELEIENELVQLACNQSINLEAGLNTTADDFTTQWSTLDGNIVSGEQGLSPVIDAPGTYTLTAALPGGDVSCMQEARVQVTEVSTASLAIRTPDTLHCQQTELDLTIDHSGFK